MKGGGVDNGVANTTNRGGIGEIPPDGGVGEEKVMLDQQPQRGDVGGVHPDPGTDPLDQVHPHHGVIAGEALAEVVEECAQYEQVGSLDPVREGGRVGGGLPQVPVDGEAVIGVALRTTADACPLREHRHQQAPLIERFQRIDGAVAVAQEPHQLVPGAVGPLDCPRCRVDPGGQPFEGGPSDRQVAFGRQPGRPPDQRRVADDIGVVGQLDQPVLLDQPRCQHPRPADLVTPEIAPCPVGDPHDRAGGRGDLGHQRVGIDDPDGRGHRVLLLEAQHVTGPTGRPVEFDPHVEQPVVTDLQPGQVARRHDQIRLGRPPQRLHVAQATVTLLEIRFEQIGDVTRLCPAFGPAIVQRRQPSPGVTPPAGPAFGGDPFGQLGVTSQRPDGQQRRRGVEVLVGQRQLIIHRANGVTELETGVPQRIPERAGQLVDTAGPAFVDQHHVDVRLGGQFPTAVATDREERNRTLATAATNVLRGAFEQLDQPGIGDVGQRRAQGPTSLSRVGHDGGPTAGKVDGGRGLHLLIIAHQ